MKQRAYLIVVAYLVLFVVPVAFAGLRDSPPGDRTLSPYFFIPGGDPDLDRMPLKSTLADVNILGVIADVKVAQVYRNEGKKPLEAVYVFPASTRAAVYAMKMTVGKRVIEAKIRKKDEARQEYEQARNQGKSASLLEQQRPNVFQMNVANILPGDTIKVELRYTELMTPEDRTYEFVYPTVVGPRYSSQPVSAAPASERWIENPHLHQAEAPSYTFDITVNLEAGMPVRKLACTTHKVKVGYDGPARAAIRLDKSESGGGNRDFVLKYQLAGDKIESGLLLSKGEKENFFLLMVQPPGKVRPAQMPAREYIFIVDVSGSMHGFPLDISKRLFRELIGSLRPSDRFNILLFAGGSEVLAERSLAATAENMRRGIEFIDRQRGGGGTELLPALRRALSLPKSEGFSRSVVIATDGYVTVEEEAFDLIRKNLDEANMFTFGIGTSVNRHLIEGMARVGMGEPFVIAKAEEAAARADAFRKVIESPLLTRIKVSYDDFDAYDTEPVSVPDVLAERPVVVFGKWKGRPRGSITITGTAGSGPYKEVVTVEKYRPSPDNSALRYLWARHRIALLSDYNSLRQDDRRIREVTGLGLRYNLLTAYTSFVAVDDVSRNTNGEQASVRQPLPMPAGVSDYAVAGSAAPAAPAAQKSLFRAARESVKGALSEPLQAEKDAPKEEGKSRDNRSAGIRVASISASGGLSADALKAVLEKELGRLQGCAAGTPLSGRLEIEVTLDGRGKVLKARIISSGLSDRTPELCLLKLIKRWDFSPAGKTEKAVIRFTLVF